MSETSFRLVGRALWLVAVTVLASSVVYVIVARAPGSERNLPSFSSWATRVVGGDLGQSESYRVGADVTGLVGEAAAESIFVVGLALLMSMSLGAAVAATWHLRGRPAVARTSRGLTYLVSASPAFLLAYWVQLGVNASVQRLIRRGIIEPPIWYPVPSDEGWIRYALAAAVLAVGSGMLMESARSIHAEVERVLDMDFILFARAGGRPLAAHLIPNLISPLASLTLNRLTALFGGAVVIEVVFNVPGLGRLTWDAGLARDAPLLLAAALVWSILYGFARLFAAAVPPIFDPRARAAQEGA